MKTSILALVLAASLSGTALAQQSTPSATDHEAHHPQASQEQPTAPAPSGNPPAQQPMPGMRGGMMGQGGMMSGMQGSQRPGGMMAGMGQGMMGCPMMQGGMAGMTGQGAMAGMQMGTPGGDQGVASLAMNAVNERMHREMAMEYTGNVDADFVRNMIAHHQGAVDMAKIEVAFGKDPKIRQLAEAVIKAQEEEIAMMRSWLTENARQ
ncbi:CopM family metallochaperone [Microvirga massiliensis]|uniref:CopM family metallochaperone n=1 Tax=Microvirga massiliensis TaxID=1033741 RepID=UPI00069BBCB5